VITMHPLAVYNYDYLACAVIHLGSGIMHLWSKIMLIVRLSFYFITVSSCLVKYEIT
jgi:hypothetical protein